MRVRTGLPTGGFARSLALAAAGLLAASAIACSSADTATPADSTVPTPTQAAASLPTVATPATEPPGTEPLATEPLPTASPRTAPDPRTLGLVNPFPGLGVDPERGALRFERIVNWNGGYLALAVIDHSGELPEALPEELAELFPPEVDAVFPDGLPATIDEATEMLEQAGQYQTVSDIVSEHPDIYDALFSRADTPDEAVLAWSADGTAWELRDVPPMAGVTGAHFTATDGQLVLWGNPAETIPVLNATGTVISYTGDLDDWTAVVVTPQLPAEPPDGVVAKVVAAAVTAEPGGWVLRQQVVLEIPLEDLATQALRPDPAVVEVEGTFADVQGGVWATPILVDGGRGDDVFLTWSELGFDERLTHYLEPFGWGTPPTVVQTWTSTWNGEPVLVDDG